MKLMNYNYINIIGKMVGLNSLILIFFLVLHQKRSDQIRELQILSKKKKISNINKNNERLNSNNANEIAFQNSTIFSL